jgi:hypothetical protein
MNIMIAKVERNPRCVELHICQLNAKSTLAPSRINPGWDYLQANQISTSSKTDKLICSFQTRDNIQSARYHSITDTPTDKREEEGQEG